MRDKPVQALLLATLERLLDIPTADLPTALTLACDAVAEATRSDKVDAFLLDPKNSSLVAIGGSNQPLSSLQRSLGLDVLPIANGGRAVEVFETRQPYRSGRVSEDLEELKGIREALKIESQVAVVVEVGGQVRGVLAISSLERDFYSAEDERFLASISRWIGSVAHRAELVEEIARNAVEQGRRAVAEELVTVLAHDLRNFITPISARIQLVRDRAEREKRGADVRDTESALKGMRRLGRLTLDLLDVARLDQGVFHLDLQPIDLAVVAAEVASTLSTPTHEVRAIASEEVVVSADPSRISQCLENLVTNALRHSPKGSPVMVIVGKRQAEGCDLGTVDVMDEGPGVPQAMVPRLFQRFSKGEGSGGLGLGLYLARRIAVAHGGDLQVESQAGKGAHFRLELPMQCDD
ncbi:GAF domain-containing sensor histidine kinase [Polyangium aurulentum]|uniref:GAF domain-containing sensor histidine kinase n=1 Tax=Polyangium aurulentum TaxID=2567896 RepID=UPI0010ADB5D9|nr:GAF domain-containing sensor histidine kinase [Polyangium aurulentum]UQA56225.1 GAF domain-containing sensor histidine kinase [Polyangium aurulentum]